MAEEDWRTAFVAVLRNRQRAAVVEENFTDGIAHFKTWRVFGVVS
jgi:hypothetical protein